MKKKEYIWYEEAMLPLRKIRYVDGCYMVSIPKNIIESLGLKKGNKVGVCIFARKKKFSDEEKNSTEIASDEELVKMTKKQRIQFEQFLKEKEKLYGTF